MNKTLYPAYPVLVVDDEEDFLNSIQMTLKRKGITNVECCNKSMQVMSFCPKLWRITWEYR